MSEASETKKGRAVAVWKIVTSDDFRQALPRMLAFRQMNREALGWRMGKGVVCRTIFNGFLAGQKQDVKLSSFLEALDGMDLECVVQPKAGRAERARAALKAERDAHKAEEEERARQAQYEAEGRDSTGRLIVLTEQARAEAEALMEKYGSYS